MSKAKRGTKAHEQSQRTASHAGFHYHNLYQCCQMKWFIRYILRINTKYTATPLINGHAFHEGKATFYMTGSKAKALRKVETEIKSRAHEFENLEDYHFTLERCPVLLNHWIDKLGYNDLKRFTIVDVEKELTTRLPGTNFIATVRPDAIVKEKDGDGSMYGMETKTSSFSIKTTEMGVHYGDQATIYMWAARAHYKQPLYAILPDIAYWNKAAKDESNIKCVRGDLVQRSDRRIAQFTAGLIQLQQIIAQKVEAYRQGADPYMLFQRNTHYCNAFFKPCEFAEICDNDLTKVKRLPPGFKRERALIKPQPFDYVQDSISSSY
jgi:hypothetical protein